MKSVRHIGFYLSEYFGFVCTFSKVFGVHFICLMIIFMLAEYIVSIRYKIHR